jgi:uncharacterized membrane protein YjjP (DUF1212 family)
MNQTEPVKPKSNPLPRAIFAGLLAGIAAGAVAYLLTGILGLIIGFIAGLVVGSRTVLLIDREKGQTP